LSPTKSDHVAATGPPCIASTAAGLTNPEPTTVTTVPTEADDGLRTEIVVGSTVNETELNPVAAMVCNPLLADVGTLNETWLVETFGHVWLAPVGVATLTPSSVIAAGFVPKYVTVTVDPLAPDNADAPIMLPVVVIVMIVDMEFVPSLTVIEYEPAAAGVLAWSVAMTNAPLASVEILPVVVE